MNKNTQIILGVGALAVVGYFVWKHTQKPKSMVGMVGGKRMAIGGTKKNTKKIKKDDGSKSPYYSTPYPTNKKKNSIN